jgi:hypothetical protein
VDTTSTYWETETADELAEPADPVDDDEVTDHRGDLPQVVIATTVTLDGVPVRYWTFPGNTADIAIIRIVKDDLGGRGLRIKKMIAIRPATYGSFGSP